MSLIIRERYSLKNCNTFGVDVTAHWYAEARNDAEVGAALDAARQRGAELLVIGGGSNLLLTGDQDVFVLRMASQGRRLLGEVDGRLLVEAEAGELWHPFVLWTLEQGLAGLENLSLIPGTVGAAPMQNIGAYGVEVKDVLHSVVALDRQTGEQREFAAADCDFAYRDSRFKRESGRWLILRVRFALAREAKLHLGYGPVRLRLLEEGIDQPTPLDVSRVICAIRAEKLPDPLVLGNAGSFFKNPVVSAASAERLREHWPELVCYPAGAGEVKLAAGWLIERAGWKGYRDGDAGVHALQALVLVNYGRASGGQLLALARRIQADIRARFGVELEIEPVVR